MGDVPFFERFKARRPLGADGRSGRAGGSLSREDKLAIVEDLEDAGIEFFWATDPAGTITYLSPAIADRIGRAPGDLLGRPLVGVVEPSAGDSEARSLSLKLGTRKAFANIVVCAGEGRDAVVMRLSGRPSFDSQGGFKGFRGNGADITEEFRADEESARLARFDALTGLSNRHRMETTIDSTVRAFRAAKRSAALIMLDLDRFKQVNDTLGHAAGDQLLTQVAERLRGAVGDAGEIGRLGGDEFQVLLPDLDDRGRLGDLARKIITMLSQPFSLEEGRCSIGASVGVAVAPYDGVSGEELTRAADLALYAAKNGGRGQFRFYASDLEHEANLRKRMEEDLSAAIENSRFKLEYEPIVALDGNRVVALEARYVWEDEERGRIAPETFLPVAEGSRLIVTIGEWALRAACADALAWPSSLRLVVPVSPVQFNDRNFVDMVRTVLEETGIAPERLELEIGEAAFLKQQVEAEKTVSALFKLGVRLALDQFGTGHVPLSYLRRAPFAGLKLGRAFFESTMTDELGDLDMVRAITELARVLRMETSAAGVASNILLDALRERGVGNVQGFVFAETMSQERVLEQIAAGDWRLDPVTDAAQRAGRRTVFRRIGIIHEDHYYDVTLRNLSRTGAMIEGLEDVPAGTQFVVDFGGGQLAVATVARTDGDTQGLLLETPLVDDGAGGLCTRHRVSPYELAAAGAPLTALPAGKYSGLAAATSTPTFPAFKLSGNAPPQEGPPHG